MIRRSSLLLVLTGILTLVATLDVTGPVAAAPPEVKRLRMRIYDQYDGGEQMQVRGDVPATAPGPNGPIIYTEYTDYRWLGLGPVDECVEGLPAVMVGLNRQFPDGSWCNHPMNGNLKARSFTIVVENENVCTHFGLSSPCNISPSNDPLEIGQQPKVRAENAFKNKSTKTVVAFLFGKAVGGDTQAWRVETTTEARVELQGSNSRLITYSGTGRMSNLKSGTLGTFPMSLRILLEQQ